MNISKGCLYVVIYMLCFVPVFVKGTDLTSSHQNCEGKEKNNGKCSTEIPRLALPHISPIKVGHEQTIKLTKDKILTMRTLSVTPPIFEIPNFFSPDECDLVIEMAKKKGLTDSPVLKDKRVFANDSTKEVFERWDTNNDGLVEADEMLMLRGNSDLYLTQDDIKQMFKDLSVDKDNDGKMSFEEFQQVSADVIKNYFDRYRDGQSPYRSRHSQQTWLWHDEDELLMYEDLFDDYHDRFANITKLPTKLVKYSEPIQVVRYEEKGHSHCHHESEVINKELPCCVYGSKTSCRFCRYLSVAVFLNDVESGGELAFPVADNSTYNWEVWTKDSYIKCNMVKHCSKSNILVKPKAGTAIMYYNHLYDKKTQWLSALDPRALVGECQVTKGEKWIAHMWMNVIGDGINELKSWKTGSNWLSKNNRNDEVISSLAAHYIPVNDSEDKKENRYTRGKNSGGNVEGPPKIENDNEVEITTEHYDALEGINMKEVKKEFLPQSERTPLKENTQNTEPSSRRQETEPSSRRQVIEPSSRRQETEPSSRRQVIEPSTTNKQETEPSSENKQQLKSETTTSENQQKSAKSPETSDNQSKDKEASNSTSIEEEIPSGPTGPEVHLGSTPAPLPFPKEQMTQKEPAKAPLDDEPLPPVESHRVLRSIMLLIDELDQVELEIVARNLHSRLKLVCVPLMINPMGGLR